MLLLCVGIFQQTTSHFFKLLSVRAAGGQCLPCIVDVRNESQIQKAVEEAVKTFGGIDIVVNNASAIYLSGTAQTPIKTFDLMHDIIVRGTFIV